MQLLTRRSLIALSAVLLAFTISTAAAAGPRHDARETNLAHNCHSDRGHVFPFLRWLRDSAVEIVFGPPPSSGRRGAKETKPDAALWSQYRKEVVVRFNVTNSEEEAALSRAANQMFLDIWAFTPEYVDIRLHRDYLSSLLTLLPKSLQPTVLIADVAAAVWNTYPSKRAACFQGDSTVTDQAGASKLVDGVGDIFFQDYQPLSVITSWMRLYEALFPDISSMIVVGKSYEGRDILGMRVGDRSIETPGPRKTILVTGGLHGREWISTSTVTYLLWSIITSYGKEPMTTKLLQHFDIVFIPVLNPDGYDYTWQTDRLWRKSRQQTKMRFCRGLDLDHAFGFEWDGIKHKADPCSESYGGDKPFQAVEAWELAEWAKNETEKNNINFIGFLDLHSYSQQVLFPYSYTCAVDPPNRENLEELAVGLAKAIRLSSGEFYSVASACEGAVARAYSASGSLPRIESGGGSAIDWFYHELHARYSYQVKLRDTGSYGFLLPKEHIVPTGEEMLNALKYFGDFLLGNNGIEKPSFQNEPLDEVREWTVTDLKRRNRVR
ncbi:hypothetical protein B0H66DRAFT_551085 [Apodospora peruviana]|uniref:Inactive metallocarboxypeptidase ECM14 n=1 Tax=Apodospora peruviana TaxID=516989 RepID=A0AAE0IKA0_9PEZI|nr:hypothetical protein B0H66DRAFT_551085 [Apodospora peruviana]